MNINPLWLWELLIVLIVRRSGADDAARALQWWTIPFNVWFIFHFIFALFPTMNRSPKMIFIQLQFGAAPKYHGTRLKTSDGNEWHEAARARLSTPKRKRTREGERETLGKNYNAIVNRRMARCSCTNVHEIQIECNAQDKSLLREQISRDKNRVGYEISSQRRQQQLNENKKSATRNLENWKTKLTDDACSVLDAGSSSWNARRMLYSC